MEKLVNLQNIVGAEDVGISVESETNQNQTEDSDFDDDSFSSVSSSHSSLVSNAPSVQHFNISVCCLIVITYNCMQCLLHLATLNSQMLVLYSLSFSEHSLYSRRPFVSMREPGHFIQCVPYSRVSTCAH